jgi:LEA14-like dessication related protein
MRDWRWFLVASVITAGIAGCATIRSAISFSEPDVALERIEITGLGLTGGTFDLILDVYNPNAFEIRGTRVELGLDLEGTHFGDALLERPLALSQQAHSRVVVPVRFEWAGVGAGAQALVTRQRVGYRLSGAVLVDTPIGERRVGVERTGDVPLARISP